MPQRIEGRELTGGSIGGIPFVVARSRDKRWVAFVGTFDGDGLLETLEDCRAAARRYWDKVDKAAESGNDKS